MLLPTAPPEDLLEACDLFYKEKVIVNKEQCKKIEQDTRKQCGCDEWKNQRQIRLTSSNFHSVYHRNIKLKVEPIVRRLLYSNFKGTSATKFGLQQEPITVQEYLLKQNNDNEIFSVNKIGIVISENAPYLAASPDGRVVIQHKDGTVERGLL